MDIHTSQVDLLFGEGSTSGSCCIETALSQNVRGINEAELILVMNSMDAGKIAIGVIDPLVFHAETCLD